MCTCSDHSPRVTVTVCARKGDGLVGVPICEPLRFAVHCGFTVDAEAAARIEEDDTYWRPAATTASQLVLSGPIRLVADLVDFEPLGVCLGTAKRAALESKDCKKLKKKTHVFPTGILHHRAWVTGYVYGGQLGEKLNAAIQDGLSVLFTGPIWDRIGLSDDIAFQWRHRDSSSVMYDESCNIHREIAVAGGRMEV